MAVTSLAVRRPAILIAIAAVVVVVLVIALAGLRGRGNGSSPVDSGLRGTSGRAGAVLNHPKLTLPVSDQSFRSFQAWYYDLKSSFSRARRQLDSGQVLEAQVYDKDIFPPQFLSLSSLGTAYDVLDANTVNDVIRTRAPAFSTVTVSGRSYRAYIAPLTVPPNLRPANAGGYFAVLQPSS